MPKLHNRRQQVRSAAKTAAATTPAGAGAIAAGKAAKVSVKVAAAPVAAASDTLQSHSHEGVLFWAFALLVFATWAGFWQPTIDAMWNGTAWNTPIDGKLILGGVMFAIVLAMIADTSDEAASVIIWMLVAMWLLFIMFNGLPTIQSFLGWFSSGQGNQQQQQQPIQSANPAVQNYTKNVANLTSSQLQSNTQQYQAQQNFVNIYKSGGSDISKAFSKG